MRRLLSKIQRQKPSLSTEDSKQEQETSPSNTTPAPASTPAMSAALSAVKSVAIIITSIRPARVGPTAGTVVKDVIEKPLAADNINVSVVQVKDFNLPVFDEPLAPAMVPDHGQLQHEHSKKWSEEIKKHDAYVLVTPEYNYGVPGSTKNAIDYLYNEWKGKPIAIVSYGIGGGSKSSAQLNEILTGMGLKVTATRPQLVFGGGQTEGFGAITTGAISDESRKAWSESEDLGKVAGEIKELLAAN
ncbi:NADPH-dependent FMN reductase [Xylariaceae sp. FL0255]|nr:NADPH-dependent FMN reductase [Xylariaceae sp. FL0255]